MTLDELIKTLRECAELAEFCDTQDGCENCLIADPRNEDRCSYFTNELMISMANGAADAIEELKRLKE